MTASEIAVQFECGPEQLIGIHHRPDMAPRSGVVIVVGGPQYRAGSHRQFTLLARHLAQQGIATFRFDYRGMGDSSGEERDFLSIQDDICCALDKFCTLAPSVQEFVLWGLCDAATACALYAHQDSRITGLVMANPWVRTARTLAQAQMKQYFPQRVIAPAFWKKLISGKVNLIQAGTSFVRQYQLARSAQPQTEPTLTDRMAASLGQFQGRVLIILSGNDLTAHEFTEATRTSTAWLQLLRNPRFSRRELDGADHTFSGKLWRDQVAGWTADWVSKTGSWSDH
jgi:exosortase A-associated hydrolase 1